MAGVLRGLDGAKRLAVDSCGHGEVLRRDSALLSHLAEGGAELQAFIRCQRINIDRAGDQFFPIGARFHGGYATEFSPSTAIRE